MSRIEMFAIYGVCLIIVLLGVWAIGAGKRFEEEEDDKE